MSVLLSMDSIMRTGIKPGQATETSEFLSSAFPGSRAIKNPVYETGFLQQQQQVERH